jgi:hypothetical protein
MAAAPFPIDLMAPAFGAQMMAAAMAMSSFEEGGIVGGMRGSPVPIVAHAGEAVLPERLTSRLNDASGGIGGGDVHLHYSPTVHAIDSFGMSDALKGHSEEISAMVMSELRRANQV